MKLSGNSLIYCARKQDVGRFAKFLLNDESYNLLCIEKETNSEIYSIFLEHIGKTFGEDWILYKALAKRIGIHHAGIPKYIQNEIINLFNIGELLCLFSTTTITEGVNTTAKNIIITAVKKGPKDLKQFDAKNIAGRAGRFYSHYSGNVIDLTQKFEGLIESRQDEIEHKNYDKNRDKTDVDLEVTLDEFLSVSDRNRKIEISEAKLESGLPEFIFQSYKTISPLDKISIYKRIERMTTTELQRINQLKRVLNTSNGSEIHWGGFQTVVDVCSAFVDNDELKQIMNTKVGKKNHSLIVIQLSSYLSKGFLGTVDYYVNEQKKTKDTAITQTAKLIYKTFKYQLVKYLGVFDLLYRYHISQIDNRNFDDVSGIQILLQRLEYNALTEAGRKLNDYGVPFALVKFYDENNNQKQFDKYEMYIDDKVQSLLKK
ncbi:helicase-related protein [Streptococcus pluranimalium]|uniref:helicase-related protein n=1 Tax=Streptococcus pluranimalium TaxID=82348 RepID=UPI003F69353D